MCEECEYDEYLDMADEMLLDEEYEFASDTIEGIKDWIVENEHITENQKTALDNIFSCKQD